MPLALNLAWSACVRCLFGRDLRGILLMKNPLQSAKRPGNYELAGGRVAIDVIRKHHRLHHWLWHVDSVDRKSKPVCARVLRLSNHASTPIGPHNLKRTTHFWHPLGLQTQTLFQSPDGSANQSP
jgi:hypothetical protein